jgi:hypothetical protein
MTLRSLLLLISMACAIPATAQVFDLVLSGGRVMDPESETH